MTADRWRRITGIFHAALERDAADREAFVAASCGDDESLRREVASMVSAHQEADRSGGMPAFAGTDDADSSSNLMALPAGWRFGPYQVGSLIGVGGMGAVYQARDTRLHRDVALKVLLPSVVADPDRIARFSREARVLASLNHPNISQVYGLEEADLWASAGHDRMSALVMELIDGPTVADRIARGPLPLDEALAIADQIAAALDAAHAHGIIHRDLKPANIKVRHDGTVKVLDFGLAKALQGEANRERGPAISAEGETLTGAIWGTASYMAPEQAKGKPVDRRADLWGFGCVLFEMLTGRRAFAGETPPDVLVRVVEHDPDWQALPAGTPASIRRLLHRCLRKDPKKRLDSAAVARIEIGDAATEPTPGPHPVGTGRSSAWRPLLWAATGAGLVLLVIMWPASRARSLEPPRSLVASSLIVEAAELPLGTPGVHFAVAPDGRSVVFAGSGRDGRVLLRRDLDKLDAERIAGTEGGSDVFFSPDGRRLGFETRSELWTAPLDGGTPQKLMPNQPMRGGTWGTGDTIVFGRVGSGLWMASTTGGEARQLTFPAQGERHELPQMLPGDRAVLFTILSSTGPPKVAVLVVETGKTRPLFEGVGARYVDSGHVVFGRQGALWAVGFEPDSFDTYGVARPVREDVLWSTAGYPQFTVDGRLLTYVRASHGSSMRGKFVLTWVDRQGRKQPLPFEPENFKLGRLSPTGDRLAVLVGAENNLWIYHLIHGTRARLTSDRIIAYSAPTWTPDGRRVVFTTWFDGGLGLGWLPADGSGPVEELFKGVGMRSFERTNPVLLPDSSGLILTGLAPGATLEDLLFVPLTGKRRLEPLFLAAGVERQAAVAPNGRFIAYDSDESGRTEVYVRPYPNVTSRKWVLSTQGGAAPVWTRDGSEIVYRGIDGRMMAIAVERDGSDPFRFSQPVPLFETGVPCCRLNLDRGWDVTADGERFLFFDAADGEGRQASFTEFVLVQNWADELTRIVPRKP